MADFSSLLDRGWGPRRFRFSDGLRFGSVLAASTPGLSCSVISLRGHDVFVSISDFAPLRRGVVVMCHVPPLGAGVVSECSLALLRGALAGHSLLRLGSDDCNYEVVACFVFIFNRFLFPPRLSFLLGLLRLFSFFSSARARFRMCASILSTNETGRWRVALPRSFFPSHFLPPSLVQALTTSLFSLRQYTTTFSGRK
jgi:hypothetical protein